MEAILKIYLKGKRKPIFEFYIPAADIERTKDSLNKKLNGPERFISFHQVTFDKELFSHFIVTSK